MAWNEDIFDEIRRIHEEMDMIFSEFFGRRPRRFRLGLSSPEVPVPYKGYREPFLDVFETKEDVVATIELPGVKKEDIDIDITESTLSVKAEVKEIEEAKEAGFYRRERRFAGFYREVSLPSKVDPEKAKATYSNGILEIRIPKKEVAKGKKIKIE